RCVRVECMPKLRCLWLRTRTVACREPHRPISAPRPTESVRLRPDPDAPDLLRRFPRRRVTARPIPSIQRTPTNKGESTGWNGKVVFEGSSAYKNFSAHYEISQLGTSQKHSLKWLAGHMGVKNYEPRKSRTFRISRRVAGRALQALHHEILLFINLLPFFTPLSVAALRQINSDAEA